MPEPSKRGARRYGPSWAHITDWRSWPPCWAAWRKPLIRWAPGSPATLVINGGRFVAYLRLCPWRTP